jgi:hypothetical protein
MQGEDEFRKKLLLEGITYQFVFVMLRYLIPIHKKLMQYFHNLKVIYLQVKLYSTWTLDYGGGTGLKAMFVSHWSFFQNPYHENSMDLRWP